MELHFSTWIYHQLMTSMHRYDICHEIRWVCQRGACAQDRLVQYCTRGVAYLRRLPPAGAFTTTHTRDTTSSTTSTLRLPPYITQVHRPCPRRVGSPSCSSPTSSKMSSPPPTIRRCCASGPPAASSRRSQTLCYWRALCASRQMSRVRLSLSPSLEPNIPSSDRTGARRQKMNSSPPATTVAFVMRPRRPSTLFPLVPQRASTPSIALVTPIISCATSARANGCSSMSTGAAAARQRKWTPPSRKM